MPHAGETSLLDSNLFIDKFISLNNRTVKMEVKRLGLQDDLNIRLLDECLFAFRCNFDELSSSSGYVNHCLRVYKLMQIERFGEVVSSSDLFKVCLFHNALEKGLALPTFDDVTFCANVIELLTMDRQQASNKRLSYLGQYWSRIASHPLAARVKICDKFDNLPILAMAPSENYLNLYLEEIRSYAMPLIANIGPSFEAEFSALVSFYSVDGKFDRCALQ